VQERLVVLTQEPTSLTDAYALIKVLKHRHGVETFRVLINMVDDAKSAREVFSRLHMACEHFLSGVSLDFVGAVPRDPLVRKAVVQQIPFCSVPGEASQAVHALARSIQTWDVPVSLDGNIKFFWKKLLFQ
jgi:flagellar biosynthesis protein FlhG